MREGFCTCPIRQLSELGLLPMTCLMTEMGSQELGRSPQTFRRGDVVRTTCELDGIASGSQGIVIDWYRNEPDRVVVYLWPACTRIIPAQALERAA
jgi:hypothetical protein